MTGRRGTDAEQAGPTPKCGDKNWEGYLGSEESWPHTRPPSPGSQCQEEKSPNFWLQKPAGTEAVEDRNFWSPKQFPLKNPHTDLLRLMPSELQWWGSKWKGIRDVQGGTELPCPGVGGGCWQRLQFLFQALPCRATGPAPGAAAVVHSVASLGYLQAQHK